MKQQKMKIRVKDEGHSKEIQKALFKRGVYWWGSDSSVVQLTNKTFLFVDKSITYGVDIDHFNSCTDYSVVSFFDGKFYSEQCTSEQQKRKDRMCGLLLLGDRFR